ncbi:MAG TPA: ABC transporter substrate-binding protein [Candidatus Methylomirabilis sp.]|nr:ABC transporter substrate-binding protein [Candidatus Methylomirabilis sp.]
MDRRRFLLTSLAGVITVPPVAAARQAGKVYRIALIVSGASPPTPVGQGLLYDRLRELGWTYERDLVVERRAYGDRMDRIPDLAAELVRTSPDVFVVEGAADAVRVRQVTQTIPIVTLRAGDLVEAGLAASLARPGGNVTGMQTLQADLVDKHLGLLKEAIPRLTRSGILFEGAAVSSSGSGVFAALLRKAEAGGKALGIAIQVVTLRDANELERVFSALHAEQAQAVIVVRSQFLSTHLNTVADLAVKHRLPTISDGANFARHGGLMSYGFNSRDIIRSAAEIIDKILRGAKASEIPIQQPTTFELVLNLKTAKALGLTIPPSLLARANQVIDL